MTVPKQKGMLYRHLSDKVVCDRRKEIEDDISHAYVNFLNTHEYSSHFVSFKTKFEDVGCVDSSMRVVRQGNIVSLCGGKITGACDVEGVIKK